MDLKICGIIDIVLILGLLIFLVLGYKKGFIKKVISWVGFIVVLFFSFTYCGQVGNFLSEHEIIYPSIYETINQNILDSFEEKSISLDAPVEDVLEEALGIPKFIAKMIGNGLNSEDGSALTATTIADSTAQYLANILMTIISFFILVIGISLLMLIFKLLANALRTNKAIRVIDGILGAALYATIFLGVVCIAFYIVSLFMDMEWFIPAKEWLTVDMQLDTGSFRLSKVIYEGNILRKILELFF